MDDSALCPCCFGAISGGALQALVANANDFLQNSQMHTNSVVLNVVVPPVLDSMRLTARTVVARTAGKSFPFPALTDVITRVLKAQLRGVSVVESKEARYEVLLKFGCDYMHRIDFNVV